MNDAFDINAVPTLIHLLRHRAMESPEQQGFIFLADGEGDELVLTYAELDRQARTIGARLRAMGAGGERLLLLYPPGLEFIAAFFGCLYAGAVAVPVYPPRRNRSLVRLQAIVSDARAIGALTTASVLSGLAGQLAHNPSLATLNWLATDTVVGDSEFDVTELALATDSLAVLQYTSGSTGSPKGVMLSHGNLLHNAKLLYHAFEHRPGDKYLTWLPTFHDMGFMVGVLQPLYGGFPVVSMPPVAFLQRPFRWLETLSRYQATTSGSPNFAYELCVRKVTPEQRATIDLSSWRVAFNGAEPVRPETIRRFTQAFESCGFRPEAFFPCYGLAEATLIVSGGRRDVPPIIEKVQSAAIENHRVEEAPAGIDDANEFVGCGQALLDTEIRIVQPESLQECGPSEVGEIWVSGGTVAQGYWNRFEETEQIFQAYVKETGEGPFLRTGDLGFLKGEELFITGRLKDLIIIDGRNHYPQDIEQTIEGCHPAVRLGCVAAFSLGAHGHERLAVVAELERQYLKTDVSKIAVALRHAVAEEHEIPVHAVALVKLGGVLKTSSGKVQRLACREAFLNNTLDVVYRWVREEVESEFAFPSDSADPDRRYDSTGGKPNAEAIRGWLVKQLCDYLKVEPQAIDVEAPFASYGLVSSQAVTLSGDLGEWLGTRLSPTLVYEHPSINALTRYLTRTGDDVAANTYSSATPTLANLSATLEPIAIIGIGCRFPGARTPQAFWNILRAGLDAVDDIPAERWDAGTFYDPVPATPGKMNTRRGGFIDQIDQFEPRFFGISPKEAIRLDPQQRLLLEVAWEALEDAGQVPAQLSGTNTGVFVGISSSEYGARQLENPENVDVYTVTGCALSVAANRLSYFFDFRGPSISIDTACSSSLVAVDLACRSIWSGQSRLALAGGANLILSPAVTINFSLGNATSPDGSCKAFDAGANGMVRSEGLGLVVLKSLSSALADGDPIYAVIRGSAVNQDGRTNGIAAPSMSAQKAVLLEAYRMAGVSPGEVQYVDAHGTGTLLGDPIEAKALGSVLAIDRAPGKICTVGSVKTNIGHLEAAAGIAGLIKVALSLKYREIPPSIHFREPNPHIAFDKLCLRVQQTLTPWHDETSPPIAAVSAFGFGGTNCHVVLQGAPLNLETEATAEERDLPHVLTLSAQSLSALRDLAKSYVDLLTNADYAGVSLRDLCYTASVRRTHHDHRLAVLCRSRSQVLSVLANYASSAGGEVSGSSRQVHSGVKLPGRPARVAFLCAGQGLSSFSVDPALLVGPSAFAAAMAECDRLIRQRVGWSAVAQMRRGAATSLLEPRRTDVMQICLFTLQVGMAAWWREWGVAAQAVLGHSVGEVAAAYLSGALGLAQAVEVVCRRGELMQAGLAASGGAGAMAAVQMTVEQAEQALAGYEAEVAVAAHNSATSCVLSGPAATLNMILQSLKEKGIPARLLPVPGAGHSPQTEGASQALEVALRDLRPRAPELDIYSTVTGRKLDGPAAAEGTAFDASYWRRNVRQRVRLAEAVRALLDDGYDTIIELSPHPLLQSAVTQELRGRQARGQVVASFRQNHGEREVMLEGLGRLYAQGLDVDWRRLYGASGGRIVQLPSYPWQRERFWADNSDANKPSFNKVSAGRSGASQAKAHPLLGQHLRSSLHKDTHLWQTDLSLTSFPYLGDHRLEEISLLPAAAYLEMALAAARQIFGSVPLVLEEVSFEKALTLTADAPKTLQLALSDDVPGKADFKISSLQSSVPSGLGSLWTLHTGGYVNLPNEDCPISPAEHETPELIKARCREYVSAREHYAAMKEHGGNYGMSFQRVTEVWRRDGEAIASLKPQDILGLEADAYQVHPALLDACFQVLAAAISRSEQNIGSKDGYLPIRLKTFRLYQRPNPHDELWSHALLQTNGEHNADVVEGDVFLLDTNGRVILEAKGLGLQRLKRASKQNISGLFYETEWESQPHLQKDRRSEETLIDDGGRWLIFSDHQGISEKLRAFMSERGEACIMISRGEAYAELAPGKFQFATERTEDFQRLLQDVFKDDKLFCRGVVYLWATDTVLVEDETAHTIEVAQKLSCDLVYLVQALARKGSRTAPRLWLVTSGVNRVGRDDLTISVTQSPLWGLAKTIAFEHPEFHCTSIDLSSSISPEEIDSLCAELVLNERDEQVALRDRTRYVARLVHSPLAEDVSQELASQERIIVTPHAPQSYQVEIQTRGVLNTLTLRANSRQAPGPDEVEIEVHAAGLNFSDILRAMNLASGFYDAAGESEGAPMLFGGECSGIISTLGEHVTDLRVGDEVIAMAPGSFSSHVVANRLLVIPKPVSLSFAEAASIPVTFTTALYALRHLGHLSAGELVLIHAAAGGVGLAALQVARAVGAEVLATAGSEVKREYLRGLGVEVVMDSRSLAFAAEVMAATGGRGVDMVLNSLSGAAIGKSLEVLAPYGRFLEIGKRDIHENSKMALAPFQKNLSYFAIDMYTMASEKSVFLKSILDEVMAGFTNGAFRPLPLTTFSIGEVEQAFRYMAQAKQTGKIILNVKGETVAIAPKRKRSVSLENTATYLITGGMGGLGLQVAEWMVRRGARHLVLLGRSAPTEDARRHLDDLERQGARVVIAQADVSDERQLGIVLDDIQTGMPPLRGIIHSAGTLDDAMILRLDAQNFKSVMAPKVAGSWNLHSLTQHLSLDFFVLFSSAASLLGSPGQGNYAAASAFLDGLAHYRQAKGLTGLSINWGPWATLGGAAQPDRGGRLVFRGIGSITPEQGVAALEHLLNQNTAQAGVVSLDMRQWCQYYPKAAESSLLVRLLQEADNQQAHTDLPTTSESPLRSELLAADVKRRQAILESHLQENLQYVLGFSSTPIDPHASLGSLGLDSLMTLELRNRLEASLGLTLSSTLVWNYPTIAALSQHLGELIAGAAPANGETNAEPNQEEGLEPSALMTELDQLSQDELASLLSKELSTLDERK